MIIQSFAGAWELRQAGTPEWLPAQVPGGVHTDLLALGRIPDPFVGDNEQRVQWVAEADWEYRLRFNPTPQLLSQPPLGLFPYRESTPFLRVLTGFLFGFSTAWFGYPLVEQTMAETRQIMADKWGRLQKRLANAASAD